MHIPAELVYGLMRSAKTGPRLGKRAVVSLQGRDLSALLLMTSNLSEEYAPCIRQPGSHMG